MEKSIYHSYEDAQKIANLYINSAYELSKGECESPTYKVCEAKQEGEYYIHVEYFYSEGAKKVKKSGGLIVMSNDVFDMI